ncbi:lysosomal amino acid transporter 1 homolog [Thalassophryne amazonica]|uniref:lysosomal amino acid transporter 1 homolog n=1 Tax=Thalassophryne amazonica TaxID=390379 RepID=UPI0014708D21|nr:lysosomal amino acid transporter 1 homolog [Thalassophryne amazonica]
MSFVENFTSLCPNGSKWVWDVFGECAQDVRDMASVYLGLLSCLCFIVSTLPQYYMSCKTQNMDDAVSIWFLLLWLGGDSCNLLGSFLADQLPLQVYTALYFVAADLVLLAMYFYYKMQNRMAEEGNRQIVCVMGVACVLSFTSTLICLPGSSAQEDIIPSGFKGRTLLSIIDPHVLLELLARFTYGEIIGFCFGSLSALLFLCSRFPQIYTNHKRKSTEGVSYCLFVLTIMGNVTYGLSVLLKNPEQGEGEASYLVHHLPWLISTLGMLLLDIIVSFKVSKTPVAP